MNPQTYAQVNLNHLIHNFQTIQKLNEGKQIICVLKADAYGHGAIPCGKALEAAGATFFAVYSIDEALQLQSAVHKPILILSYLPEARIDEAILSEFRINVYTMEMAEEINERAVALNQKAHIHISINTGMERLGFPWGISSVNAIESIIQYPMLNIEGIFTHYATADEQDLTFATEQYQRFEQTVQAIEKKGIHIPMIHIDNSAGSLYIQQPTTTAVRPGLALLGIDPTNPTENPHQLKPVMSLYTTVINLHTIHPGDTVSYGRKYTANTDKIIATLCIGYADGFFRYNTNKGAVCIQGKKAPILGSVCMDMCMVDVSQIPNISIGDRAEVFGNHMSAAETAATIETIPYELFCAVNKRVPRIYER